MRLTVTGANGFVGRHVAAVASVAGHEVIGVSSSQIRPDDPLNDLLVTHAVADLRNAWPAQDCEPDAVVHLAGLAAVGPSFDTPRAYIDGNSAMVTSMMEELLVASRATRVVLVSTGAVYRSAASPLTESSATLASSPYVVSKLLVELQAEYYRQRGLDVVVARPFNHVGPGQRRGFIVPDLVSRVSVLGSDEKLAVGRMETRRDYTDVRDVARAYLDLATSPLRSTVFNIASGVSRSGLEILEEICAALGRPVPQTEPEPSQLRPTDPSVVTGDASRLERETGWKPRFSLEQSIRDFAAASGLAR